MEGFSQFPLKVVEIKRLAVDVRVIRMRLEELLLINAFEKIVAISSQSKEIVAVKINIINEDFRCLYEKFGFKYLSKNSNSLYLSLDSIKKLF